MKYIIIFIFGFLLGFYINKPNNPSSYSSPNYKDSTLYVYDSSVYEIIDTNRKSVLKNYDSVVLKFRDSFINKNDGFINAIKYLGYFDTVTNDRFYHDSLISILTHDSITQNQFLGGKIRYNIKVPQKQTIRVISPNGVYVGGSIMYNKKLFPLVEVSYLKNKDMISAGFGENTIIIGYKRKINTH